MNFTEYPCCRILYVGKSLKSVADQLPATATVSLLGCWTASAQRKNLPSITPSTRMISAAYMWVVGRTSLVGFTAVTVVEL